MTECTAVRHARKAEGLCVDCGDIPPIRGGYVRCKICLRSRAKSQREQRERWAIGGKCCHCGRILPTDETFKQCAKCRERNNKEKARKKDPLTPNGPALMKAG